MDLITYFKELISLAMDSIPFNAVICYFLFGLIVFNHRATNKVLLRWRIPRKMIIPLRILLSTILFVLSFSFINDENISSLFKLPFAIGYMIITLLCPVFILLLIRFISSKAQKNWNNWWQNIVFASTFTSLIWLFTRKDSLIAYSTLWGPLTLILFATIWHFITLYIYAKHRKHYNRIRYCLLSYLILACLFFTSGGGYRNPERNYTIEESKEAEAFLWEYDVFRMSKHIPEALQLPIKYAYAERHFDRFKYDNDFTNKRLPDFGENEYQINILFEKKFNDHDDHAIEKPFFDWHEPDYNLYRLIWKGQQDTIPPPDTVRFCFKYSLESDSTIISDTLLLIKKESEQTPNAMKLFNKQSSDKKVVTTIPEESFIAIEPTIDGHKALTIINTSLKDFAHKEVFSWNLSIIFHFEDAEENGMPKDDGMERIQQFCEDLEQQFNDALGKPNALFTFRETYNGISNVCWRVYDADIIEDVLQKVIEEDEYPFDFEYRFEYDKDWELVAWYLQDF